MPEFKYNPLKGRNELLVKKQVECMNRYAKEGNYVIAAMYRDMVWDCETFFGKFPEDAKVYKTFGHRSDVVERSVATEAQ